MKLEALDHPKTLSLASRLQVEIPTAIGYLELLWAFAGKKTPQGNIGKWDDGAIAVACFWRGDPAHFVECLVAAGLLDRHPEHRLLVHDWAEHAPNWVKAKVIKSKTQFCAAVRVSACVSGGVSAGVSDGARTYVATDAATDTPTDVATDTASSRARVLPSEAKGREVYVPDPTPPLTPALTPDSSRFETEIQEIYPACNGARLWFEALRECRQQVEAGETTWEELIAFTRIYREFVDAGGVSGPSHVLTPQKFFDSHAKLWRQPRELPKSRATRRLASNLNAADEFMRRTERAV